MAENRSGGRKRGGTRGSGGRERIENPQSGTSYVRRDDEGKFQEVENVGRAAAGDQVRDAESESRRGFGDQGDRDVRGESPAGRRGSSGSESRSTGRSQEDQEDEE